MAAPGHDEDDPIEEWLQGTGLKTCPACGNPREILDYEDLPPTAEPTVDIDAGDSDFFLYCRVCDNYSVGGFGGSSFDDVHSTKSSSFASAPSRNSPCLCGSGKKYKRCCGKN